MRRSRSSSSIPIPSGAKTLFSDRTSIPRPQAPQRSSSVCSLSKITRATPVLNRGSTFHQVLLTRKGRVSRN
nr:unnamed protein product [Callosobruchus analis]